MADEKIENYMAPSEVLAVINAPGNDAQRGLALMRVAGKNTQLYDLEGRATTLRAEGIQNYLDKGFTVDPKPEQIEDIIDGGKPAKVSRTKKTAEAPLAPITTIGGNDGNVQGDEHNP